MPVMAPNYKNIDKIDRIFRKSMHEPNYRVSAYSHSNPPEQKESSSYMQTRSDSEGIKITN